MVPAHGQTHRLVGYSRGPIIKPTQIQPFDFWKKVNTHTGEKPASSTAPWKPDLHVQKNGRRSQSLRFAFIHWNYVTHRKGYADGDHSVKRKEPDTKRQTSRAFSLLWLVDMFRGMKAEWRLGKEEEAGKRQAQVEISESGSEYSWIHCVLERDFSLGSTALSVMNIHHFNKRHSCHSRLRLRTNDLQVPFMAAEMVPPISDEDVATCAWASTWAFSVRSTNNKLPALNYHSLW